MLVDIQAYRITSNKAHMLGVTSLCWCLHSGICVPLSIRP